MKTYLISYDLRIPETSEDYSRLIDFIKSYNYWAKPLKSVWFIKTNKTVNEVRDEIKNVTDQNDGFFVIEVTGSDWATFGINNEVTNWLKSNL